MEGNKLLTLLVTITVGIIFIGALLAPVIEDTSSTEKTFDNTEFARNQMKQLEDGDTWTRSNEIWYYGEEVATTNKSGSYSVLFTDNMVVREIGNVRGLNVSFSSNQVTSMAVNEGDTSLNLTYNSQTTSYDFEYGFGTVAEGDYILKGMNYAAYVLGDTEVYVTGVTPLASGNTSEVLCTISGSVKDGFTVNVAPVKNATVSDITVGEVTVNATPVEGYVNLYQLTNITFDITGTYSDTETTITATYGTFVMPKMVTAELSQHLDAGEIAILAAIPLMAIAALILLVVRYFVAGRD